MTGSVAPDVPALDTARSTAEPKIRTSIITLRDALNDVLSSSNNLDGGQIEAGTIGSAAYGTGSVTSGALASGAALGNLTAASVSDTLLTSPNSNSYRSLMRGGIMIPGSTGTGTTYLLGNPGGIACASGGELSGTGQAEFYPSVWAYNGLLQAVAGKTLNLLIVASYFTNATSFTRTAILGLSEITAATGSLGGIAFTAGTAVTGSAVTISAPAINFVGQASSSAFTNSVLTTGKNYCFTMAIVGGAVPAGAGLYVQLDLMYHHL